ncbi:MAG TPA: sensor histidine kinase [Verrucomicrobiae bacterium]|jgi:signal transduction histidine kinase
MRFIISSILVLVKALLRKIETWPEWLAILVSLTLIIVVGIGDYVTGYEAGFFIFYFFPLILGTWRVGSLSGISLAMLCAGTWYLSNFMAGSPFPILVNLWNAFMLLVLFLVAVGMVKLYKELEDRVRERTSALTEEMAKRRRLEKELLETSEREQRRIGHDLHDSLCQHLTGTALAGQVLEDKLADKALPETAAANRVVYLIEEAIGMTRSIARGLNPLEMQAVGIEDHFQDMATNISEQFNIICKFECPQPVPLRDPAVITHLYRITQEAITNAIRHGKARCINVGLDAADGEIVLTVTDDGAGFRENQNSRHDGMGLHIMAYRASMIGATINIERLPTQGTRVTCTLPAVSEENHAAKK